MSDLPSVPPIWTVRTTDQNGTTIMTEYKRAAHDTVWQRLYGNPECDRMGCRAEATYVADSYGTRERLCPYHAYGCPNRRPLYPNDR